MGCLCCVGFVGCVCKAAGGARQQEAGRVHQVRHPRGLAGHVGGEEEQLCVAGQGRGSCLTASPHARCSKGQQAQAQWAGDRSHVWPPLTLPA